ncbi:MAG: UbiA family prenyltransferase [Acidobacteria bacterium]|nr:UbiA family prenyltransferase [Acidobacteriota bacterium]
MDIPEHPPATPPAPAAPPPEPLPLPVAERAPIARFRELLDMIKFEHTVFALPFAFLGALAGAQGIPATRTLLWILVAMVGARTAAMTFNRLVDADVDAANPRTAQRAIPAGRVSRLGAIILMGAGIVAFGVAAGALGPLTWKLSPVAMAIILGYSLCKRFTAFAHVVLGLSLAGAPLGAWIAVTGQIERGALLLAMGVLTWTAGFDILYALQDEAFDRKAGLHSVPSKLGTRGALILSRVLHLLALACWASFNLDQQSHLFPWLAWAGVAMILFREQWLVRDGDLTRMDEAFFTLNALIGLVYFSGHAVEIWMRRALA